jgi:autotransporter-associated beta strand protein
MLAAVGSAFASYQSTIQTDNPIAYFGLDALDPSGAGTASDLSGNGNDSSYINVFPITGPTPYISNAGQFDPNSESSVNLPTAGILNFSGNITMEAWVQPVNPAQSLGDIIAKGYDAAANLEIALRVNQNQYQGGSYSNGVTKMASGGVVTTNWAYIVTTFDGANWNTYVNTKLVAQTADTAGALNFSDSWAIGNGTIDGNGRYFNGNICQVALYASALTPAQIVNHYVVAELNAPAAGAPPVIAEQPQPQASYVGGAVTFSVFAVSASQTTNLWFKDGNPIASQTNSTLVLSNLSLSDAGNYTVVVGNVNGTTNSSVAALTVATPANLQWSGAAGATWDAGVTASWLNLSNSATTTFNFGDAVLFDDTPGVPTDITISGLVTPSTMTVDSANNSFTFNPYSPGNNTISGPVKLVKKGTSTLTLATAGQFSGPVDVEGGAILAEGYSFQSVPSIVISNNAMVDLTGGSYNNINQYIYMSGTGINGQGALFNSLFGASFVFNIVLTGDAKMGCIGGTSGLGLTGGSISGPHVLTLDWQNVNGYNEWDGPINIGADVVGIDITNGTLGIKYMTTACQNPNTVFTAETNTTFAWWNGSGGFNGSIHMRSNSIARLWSAGTVYNGSTITLDGPLDWSSWGDPGDITFNSAVVLNGLVHIIIGDHNMIYTNVLSGPGGLFLDYWNHAMILSASNTYSGPTIINDGLQVNLIGNGSISGSSLIFFGGNNPGSSRLDVSGRLDQTLTLANGQILAGIGGINGSLVVSSGATISPSGTNATAGVIAATNSTGTLAVANGVTLNGTTIIKLNGSGTNDVIQAAANIQYGGTLNLVNISGAPLVAGDSFQVFSAANYTGSFANLTPAVPGPGLAWDTSQLNSGVVKVATGASQPVISSTKVSGGNLIFSGTGGTALGSYSVLTTTNIATPLSSWTILTSGAFDGVGGFSITNPINPASSQQFYLLKTP